MPPAAKRRKVVSASRTAPATSSIAAFTRTSKSVPALSKEVVGKEHVAAAPLSTYGNSEGRKRKAVDVEITEIELDSQTTGDAHIETALVPAATQRLRIIKHLPASKSICPRTPRTPYQPVGVPSSIDSDTPTKGVRGLFDDLAVTSSPSAQSQISFQSLPATRTVVQDNTTPSQEISLPIEFQHLIDLHSSFLTALSIHHAHNGTHVPTDLRELLPNVGRTWGRRGVTTTDIRRLIALQVDDESTTRPSTTQDAQLSLSDYGAGRICIDTKITTTRAGRMTRPIDERTMNKSFATNLLNAWKQACGLHGDTAIDAAHFIEHLPLEPIIECENLSKVSPMLAKGQRRLQDIRAAMLQRKAKEGIVAVRLSGNDSDDTNTDGSEDPSQEVGSTNTNSSHLLTASPFPKRKLTLLERLQAKHRTNLLLPPPPTKAALARRAALHRLDEVISVIALLSTGTNAGQARVSFTLATVVGKVRDSAKNAIGKGEAEACIRLLVSEVVPEWVRLCGPLGREMLVVLREGRIKGEVVRTRIEALLEKDE